MTQAQAFAENGVSTQELAENGVWFKGTNTDADVACRTQAFAENGVSTQELEIRMATNPKTLDLEPPNPCVIVCMRSSKFIDSERFHDEVRTLRPHTLLA